PARRNGRHRGARRDRCTDRSRRALPGAHEPAARRCPLPGPRADGAGCDAEGTVRRNDERGAVTMLVLAILGVALVVCVAVARLGSAPVAAPRAQPAPAAAALAAADQLALGQGDRAARRTADSTA